MAEIAHAEALKNFTPAGAMSTKMAFPERDKPLHLLVVDDQDFDRTMICARLREVAPADTVIVEAACGEEVIGIIQSTAAPFDCVLLDMNLPDIHGAQLTPMILALQKNLSIIMITVEADMDKALASLKAGAQDFLIKGEYSNAGLYRAVRYAMERQQAAIENIRLNAALAHEREVSAMQKDFIHLVSHEFRTPLAIISGAMQMLAAKAPELKNGIGQPQFMKVDAAIVRLVGLLDNVLRLSQLEEGKELFVPVMFDMCDALRLATESFDAQRLDIRENAMPVHYFGDQRLVEYAIHNVVGNALKYSPPEARVEVAIQTLPQAVEVVVTDHGPGMSAAMVARAGEKFFRDSSTSHIEGTGLGIHLAKRFMEFHGGSLMFESEQGNGTTVRMVFPYEASALVG
jgi:signal transduction histidine kinase